jgi:signal transduction histidine kinase
VLAPVSLVAIGALVWSWSLKRQVSQRTRGLQAELEKRQRAEKRLLAYQNRLRALASELGLAAERERRRIAIYIHDTLAQALAAAKMKLDALHKATAPETPGQAEVLDEVRNLVGQAAMDARSLTFDLSPPVLHELGLAAALAWLAEDMGKKHGLAVTFEDDQTPKPIAEARCIVLFRAVRELLTNVTKHAQARRAGVSVGRTDEHVRITVEDDGVGFDPQCVHAHEDLEGGFGLFSIRERLDYLGGRMEIRSGKGRGTRVTLTAPLDRKK